MLNNTDNPQVQTTADGSPTLYLPDIDEHYHSVKGAMAESQYVYIDLGWREYAERFGTEIKVFEVGFGTGLNAAICARAALESKVPTIYFAIELYPLAPSVIESLLPCINEEYSEFFKSVNSAEWNKSVDINPYFRILKIKDNLLTFTFPEGINVVFFDAFAPEKQPEMWDKEIFRRLYTAMTPGAVITTYCAKGAIRRMLGEIGFQTERLPGPPAGKREVLRASRSMP